LLTWRNFGSADALRMFFTGLRMVSGFARLNPPKPAVDFPADVPTLAATSFVEETE
jgi:hypothetical protein